MSINPNFLITATFLLALTLSGHTQPNTKKLAKIPSSIPYRGTLKEALTWSDTTGTHIVILSATDPTPSKNWKENDSYLDVHLYACHYLLQNNKATLQWKIQDFVKECPLDLLARFIPNTLKVTDLDKDQTPEIWVMYITACRGDVSPADLKIICYEGPTKMAMRGTSRMQVSETEYAGGQYTFDDAFKKSPPEFKKYAETLWKMNVNEKFQ